MVLNYIWVGFFLIAFATALVKLIFLGDLQVFNVIMDATFSMSKTAFEIALGLTGVLTLWMGIMKIGEAGGVIKVFAKLVGPFFKRLFPEVPAGHPALGSMVMNFAANMLGLDNAATPIGLKAMQQLQQLNPSEDTASNAQIMFLVLNTSGLTLIPVSILVYRVQAGAANPADVFIPIMLATFFSTLAGLVTTSIYQKINLFDRVIMAYLLGACAFIALLLWYFSSLTQETLALVSTSAANIILFSVISLFILSAVLRRVNVYQAFIEGAKEGFSVAVSIIPYLVSMLVAIAVFRASGIMDIFLGALKTAVNAFGFDAAFVDALPTALMKPLSGSGARSMMVDAMATHGADSFVGRLASTFQGATDTTFYIIAVYFGSVAIRKTRHAVICALIADAAGIIAALFVATLFWG